MKNLIALIISGALVVSGYSQTRNVLVGTNNAVVQPTNFWSGDASNARVGLGLGSAATNPASAFQSSSLTLSNLASSNGGSLTNLTASSVVGTLSLGQGGTGSTNASNARTALGLGTAATNPASAFQPSSTVLTNLAANNGSSLTNIPVAGVVGALATNGNGSGITNLTASNITGTVALASNVTGTIAISNGGSGATTAGGARTNLGLGALNNVTFNSLNVAYIQFSGNDVLIFDENPKKIYGDWEIQNGAFSFLNASNAARTRTNFGLGWSALTNTTSSGFQTALFGTNTNPVLVNTNGEVVTPTNFWQVAPISTTVQYQTNIVANSTNNATNSRNLFLFSLSPSVSGVTNTVQLPTNPATTFEGDRATITHLGQTNTTVTAIRQSGAGTNLITINQLDETVAFIYRSGAWRLADNISYIEPIYFSGTNAAANAAASRTNLGLPLAALTNTDVTNFRTAIELGTTNNVAFSNIASSGALTSTGVVTALSNVSVTGTLTATGSVTTATNLNVGGSINVTNKAETRTNLGIPLAALTNTNVTNFRTAIGLGATNTAQFQRLEVSSGTNASIWVQDGGKIEGDGDLYITAGSLFFEVAPEFGGTNASLLQAATRTNLGLGATWLTNTNVTNFRNSIQAADSTSYGTGVADKAYGLFDGPNDQYALIINDSEVTLSQPESFRSALGLPLPALTNTNNANFQAAIFNTNSAPTNSANVNAVNFNTAIHWMEVNVVTNGVTNNFRIPLFK
jgi:hypothetical protein